MEAVPLSRRTQASSTARSRKKLVFGGYEKTAEVRFLTKGEADKIIGEKELQLRNDFLAGFNSSKIWCSACNRERAANFVEAAFTAEGQVVGGHTLRVYFKDGDSDSAVFVTLCEKCGGKYKDYIKEKGERSPRTL